MPVLLCFLFLSAPAAAQIPVKVPAPAPTIAIGGAKDTAAKVAEILASLETREKALLSEQGELLRWRDELAAVGERVKELKALRETVVAALTSDKAAAKAAPGAAAKTDPALLPHVDLMLELLNGEADVLSSLAETFRQEQREVAQALKLARKLSERLAPAAAGGEGKAAEAAEEKKPEAMVLDEVLRYQEEVSRARISLSLLKARRAGLNEELEQRLKEKRPPFALPPLEEFSGDQASRQQTLALREEATNLAAEAGRYRKLLTRHVAGHIEAQLEGIRLEIYDREEQLSRLDREQEQVFLALTVSDAELQAGRERLEAAQKRIEEDERLVQKQLKTLRTTAAPEKEPGSFSPYREWEIRITALQHRLYLLDIERQVELFREGTLRALHSLTRLQAAPADFWKEFAWYLDEDRQVKAREEIETRREAWRQEYSQLSLEEPDPGDQEIASRVLEGYREVLSLYDHIDARKWEIAWCAELVRYYDDRYELSQRDTFWYVWRSAVSVLMLAVAIFLSIMLNRATLRPIRKRPDLANWLRNTLFLSYLAGLVLLWGALVVLTITNVWGALFQFDRLSQMLSATIFSIGDKEVSVIAIATFLGILALTVVVNRMIGQFLRQHIFTYFTWDEGIRHAVLAVIKYLILFSGISLGLEFIGIGLGALALFAGVIGIGIGFGLQNVASNFISGLIILFERPIKKGDFVDAAGLEGRVEEIRARATTLVTRDRVSVIVPNTEFIGKSVINLSHGSPEVRLHIKVAVAYGSDLDKVRQVLAAVADAHELVLKNPAPDVLLTAFGDSALSFELLVWTVEVEKKGKIISDLNFAIDAAFRANGIEIPFPQIDVHSK